MPSTSHLLVAKLTKMKHGKCELLITAGSRNITLKVKSGLGDVVRLVPRS